MSEETRGDFDLVDMESGWETPPGYPPGIESKMLADTLNEGSRTGHRTMLMRYRPGAKDARVLEHETVEEVWILDGELEWLGEGETIVQRVPRHAYVCRPPGVPHGPFRSREGRLLLAMFYYPEPKE